MNLLSHTLTKTQQAPPLVQSCFVDPAKSASKKNQFSIGGVYLISIKNSKSIGIIGASGVV